MKPSQIILLLLFLLFRSHLPSPTKDEAAEHYSAAVELYKEGKVEEATVELEEVIKSYPKFALAHNLLGQIYRRMEDLLSRFKSERELRKVNWGQPSENRY